MACMRLTFKPLLGDDDLYPPAVGSWWSQWVVTAACQYYSWWRWRSDKLGVSLTMLWLQMHCHVSFKVSLWRFTLQQSHRYVAVGVLNIMCVTVISRFWFCIYFCCSLGLVSSFLCLLIRTHCWTQSSLLCCWTTDKHNVRLEYHELHQYFHLPLGNGHLLDSLVCITVNGGWLFLTKTVTLALSDSSPVWKQFPYMCFCYPWDFANFMEEILTFCLLLIRTCTIG